MCWLLGLGSGFTKPLVMSTSDPEPQIKHVNYPSSSQSGPTLEMKPTSREELLDDLCHDFFIVATEAYSANSPADLTIQCQPGYISYHVGFHFESWLPHLGSSSAIDPLTSFRDNILLLVCFFHVASYLMRVSKQKLSNGYRYDKL
jgi:hypothetical protein